MCSVFGYVYSHQPNRHNAMKKIDKETLKLFKTPAKRNAWIKFQLSLQGDTLTSLAKRYGCHKQQPVKALTQPYPAWEKRFAKEFDIALWQLFPERYDPSGVPLRFSGKLCYRCHVNQINGNTLEPHGNSQNVAQS